MLVLSTLVAAAVAAQAKMVTPIYTSVDSVAAAPVLGAIPTAVGVPVIPGVSGVSDVSAVVHTEVVQANPFDATTPVATLPGAPTCKIRIQTIQAIQAMRVKANQLAAQMHTEIQHVNQRKLYIEEMTRHINELIIKMNKVKADLSSELEWVEKVDKRIKEMQEKEKLMKVEDVLACMTEGENSKKAEDEEAKKAKGEFEKQKKELEEKIKKLNEPAKK